MILNYIDLCSGISAPTLAWKPLGWRALCFAEIDAAPRAVLAHHYPDVPLRGDFTEIEGNEYGPVDLVVGGTPCQDFAASGLRAGLDGARGNLTLHFGGLVRRAGARWFLWENVTGAFSTDGGRDFGAVLACFAGYPAGTMFLPPADGWRNAGIVPAGPNGHGLAWRVLDAQYFGVPQRRRRVFIVGYIGDWRPAAAALLERAAMSGAPAPRRETEEDLAYGFCGPATPGIAKPIGAHTSARGRGCDLDNTTYIGVDLVQITSAANRTRLAVGRPLSTIARSSRMAVATEERIRYMTPIEHERAFGIPDNFTLVPYRGRMMADGPRNKMCGNSMAVPVVEWIGRRIAAVEAILQASRPAA